jgi:hypothetical protein
MKTDSEARYKTKAYEIYRHLLNEGHDSQEIHQCAKAYAIEASSSGSQPLPLADWLQAKPWEQRRN